MKKVLSMLLMSLTMSAGAQGIPSYGELEVISFPQTQDYVEALVEDLKRPANCRLNGRRLPFTEVQTVFQVTIGDRLRLLLENNDMTKLYSIDEWRPALLITTLHEKRSQGKLYDELRFYLSEDAKTVRSIEFDQFKVIKKKTNEGTIRNPIMVTKEVLESYMNIRCVL